MRCPQYAKNGRARCVLQDGHEGAHYNGNTRYDGNRVSRAQAQAPSGISW